MGHYRALLPEIGVGEKILAEPCVEKDPDSVQNRDIFKTSLSCRDIRRPQGVFEIHPRRVLCLHLGHCAVWRVTREYRRRSGGGKRARVALETMNFPMATRTKYPREAAKPRTLRALCITPPNHRPFPARTVTPAH